VAQNLNNNNNNNNNKPMEQKYLPLIIIVGIFLLGFLIAFVNIIPFIIFLVFLYTFNKDFFKKFLDLKPKKSRRKSEKIIEVGDFNMKKIQTSTILSTIIGILFLTGFIYYFRPWFHELIIFFFIKPTATFALISIILVGIGYLIQKNWLIHTSFILFILFAGLFSFSTVIEQKYIVDSTEYAPIDSLPETNSVRILPEGTAKRYLDDSFRESREKIGTINIVNFNDTLHWVAPKIPDGTLLYFTQKVNGVMIVDATKTQRTTTKIEKKLEIGEGIGIFDNIFWNLLKEKYFINLGEIYYIYENNEILTVAPIIKYKFQFPVMIPYYAGVFTIKENGEINSLSPKEVQENPIFDGNRAYPEALARFYIDSYKYKHGILNAWFFHKDQIEIADVYGQNNKQPFLMPSEDGLKWIIATEPYGKSYGVFKIFLVDALTGKIEVLHLEDEKTLTGPVRVVSYIMQKFPIIDWSASKIVEPRPYVIDKTLYWMLSITPNDFAGIAYTVFVNSETNEVYAFQTDEEIFEFIKGEYTGKPTDIIIDDNKDQEKATINITRNQEIEEKIAEIEKLLQEIKNLNTN
jgi:hypothetical protein